jgi:hypothetical protein
LKNNWFPLIVPVSSLKFGKKKKKGSNNIKTEKEGENFLAAKAQINEVKEEMYHSKIDLVGVGVSKKSLGYTSDGVLRSWAHMLPPSKGPA